MPGSGIDKLKLVAANGEKQMTTPGGERTADIPTSLRQDIRLEPAGGGNAAPSPVGTQTVLNAARTASTSSAAPKTTSQTSNSPGRLSIVLDLPYPWGRFPGLAPTAFVRGPDHGLKKHEYVAPTIDRGCGTGYDMYRIIIMP